MSTLLHVIIPGANYIPGGTPTEVDLSCINDSNKKVLCKIEKIVIHITNYMPLVFDEVTSGPWDADYLSVTKITNPCTTEVTYAVEYYPGVIAAAQCCLETVPEGGIVYMTTGDGEYYVTENGDNYIL